MDKVPPYRDNATLTPLLSVDAGRCVEIRLAVLPVGTRPNARARLAAQGKLKIFYGSGGRCKLLGMPVDV